MVTCRRSRRPYLLPCFQFGLGRVLRPARHTAFPPLAALLDARNPGYFASATLFRMKLCGILAQRFPSVKRDKIEKQSENRETIAEQYFFVKVLDNVLREWYAVPRQGKGAVVTRFPRPFYFMKEAFS